MAGPCYQATLPNHQQLAPGIRVWDLLCSDSSSPFFQAQTDAWRLPQGSVPSKSSKHWQELHHIKTLVLSLTVPLYCVVQLGLPISQLFFQCTSNFPSYGVYCFELTRMMKKHHGLLLRSLFQWQQWVFVLSLPPWRDSSNSSNVSAAPLAILVFIPLLVRFCRVEHIVWAYICYYCFAAIFFSSSCHPWIYLYLF